MDLSGFGTTSHFGTTLALNKWGLTNSKDEADD